jgi:uncharacterized protein YbaR (Trm112 family)
VNLDPVLLEILVCPDCKGALTVDQDHDELVCNGCGLIYTVRDNIPIMLVDEARRPAPAKKTSHRTKAGEGSAGADPATDASSDDDAG